MAKNEISFSRPTDHTRSCPEFALESKRLMDKNLNRFVIFTSKGCTTAEKLLAGRMTSFSYLLEWSDVVGALANRLDDSRSNVREHAHGSLKRIFHSASIPGLSIRETLKSESKDYDPSQKHGIMLLSQLIGKVIPDCLNSPVHI